MEIEQIDQKLIDDYQPKNKLKVLFYVVHSEGALIPQDITNKFNYFKNYTAKILSELESSNLIVFLNGDTDKRTKILKASEKGRLLVDMISKKYFFIDLA